MCEYCVYKRNCQFLAKHRNAIVADCSVFKDERMFISDALNAFVERLKQEAFRCDISLGSRADHCTSAVSMKVVEEILKEVIGDDYDNA